MSSEEEAVLILEASTPSGQGDVSIYRDRPSAENGVEAIDVTNKEFFAFTLRGRKLSLTVREGKVHISDDRDDTNYHDLVRRHLIRMILAMPRNLEKGEREFDCYDIVELAEIFGFSR